MVESKQNNQNYECRQLDASLRSSGDGGFFHKKSKEWASIDGCEISISQKGAIMQDPIIQLQENFEVQLRDANSIALLEDLRVKLLGKKGEVTQLLKSLGSMSPEERPIMGQRVNALRLHVEKHLEEARHGLEREQTEQALLSEKLDVTLPGRKRKLGHLHPLTIVLDEMKELFIGMGFTIADGPDVETDYYVFEALNIPANHPVKDEQDTFYVEGGFVMRTQTSGVQIRVMEKQKPPIRIIAPGAVYRADDWDATHAPVFHQLEGLVVDEGITMGDLKGILTTFAQKILGEGTQVRFRPSFFPFTEPSAEMDVQCYVCGGKEPCRVCKDTGWIELLGCGMVHPNVLRNCNIDPTKYSGYAFGMGIDRIVLQRYGIPDLRLLYENDMQFLAQF